MGTAPRSTTADKPARKRKAGTTTTAIAAAAGGDSKAVLKTMRWTHALALAAGAVGAEVATTKWPTQTTFFEKDGQPDSGIDIRWPVAAAVLGYGYWKGFAKLNPYLTAGALGVGLSWVIDRIVGMWTGPAAAAAAPAPVASEGIYIGQIDDDTGAIGMARRLNRTEGALNGLRRGAAEDRLQSRLQRRVAAGKPITQEQARFLAQERREDAASAQRRIPMAAPVYAPPRFAGGGGGQAMVRVPIAAVKPAFLAQMA